MKRGPASTPAHADAARPASQLAPRQGPVLERRCACGQHASGGECRECKKKGQPPLGGEAPDRDELRYGLHQDGLHQDGLHQDFSQIHLHSGEVAAREPAAWAELPTTGTRRPAAARLLRSELTSSEPSADSVSVNEALLRRGRGEPLNEALRCELEQRFDADLRNVHIHTDSVAAAAAADVAARAFTIGEDIYFAAGEPSPSGTAGRELLAHELTHVVQHQRGRAPATGGNLRVSDPDESLEQEARRVSRRIAAGGDADIASPVTSRPSAPVAETLFRQEQVQAPIVQSFGEIRLVQIPSEGKATLLFRNQVWALFHWEPQPGRQLGSEMIGVGTGTKNAPDRSIATVQIMIKNSFAVDVVIDLGVEQAIANATGQITQVTDRFSFPGRVSVQRLDGSRELRGAAVAFAHEYTPRSLEELGPTWVPPREIAPEGEFAPPRPKPPQPAFKDWKFKDPVTYNQFATSHKDTKWAEVLTKDGQHVAYALTVEAITRMAEKVRNGQSDFEFLAKHYPGGKVVGLHIYGKKLDSVEAVGELYFRTRTAALDGGPAMLPECEVYKMEGGRFGRKSLGHSQALVRWKELSQPPTPIEDIETFPGHKFQGLRVRGDTGMQTIYPQSFADPKRRTELEGDFKSFDPIADDVNHIPADFDRITYPQIAAALKKLIARKRDISEGREPTDDLDAINDRITRLEEKLAEQGVQMDENQIIGKLDAGKDLKEFDGRILMDPAPSPIAPNYFGQRITARIQLDYVPPGATVQVRWTWRPADRADDPRLPPPVKGEEFSVMSGDAGQQIDLGTGFWNQLGVLPRIVEQAKRIQLVARVSLNDNKAVVLTRESDWIDFGKGGTEPPAKLTITGKSILIAGEEGRYQLAEWTPLRHHHYFVWTEDGKQYPSRVSSDLFYISHSVGKHKLSAQVYPANNDGTAAPVREATPIEVEVQDPHDAGQQAIARMEKEKQPGLGDEARSTETSISEIEKKVAQGGGAQAYWEKRLEQQKHRLAKLNELAPDARQSKDLPTDPTALKDREVYSGPISAVLVVGDAGGVQPLSIHVTAHQEGGKWKVRLIDSTSSDVWKFDGAAKDTPLEAYKSAFQAWENDNPYPQGGRLVHNFKPTDWTLGDGFDTSRWDKRVKTWVDGIAIVAGALLMLVPEPTGLTKLIGGLILVATTVKAGVSIYENIQMGMDPLDSRNVFEGISIVTSFLGVGGTALRSVGIAAVRPLTYRVGNYLVLSAIAIDAGTLVYATHAAIGELRAIASDPTLSDGQKSTQILSVMTRLAAQGLIFFHANKQMFKGGLKKSDYFATNPDKTAAGTRKLPPGELPKLDTGSRLDLAAELRKAGEAPARLGAGVLPDHVLIERYYQLPWLNETLAKGEVAQMLNRLETQALKGLSDIPAAHAKSIADGIGNDAVVNELAPALKGSKLDELAKAGGAPKIAEHHTTHGGDGVVWAASDLSGKDAMELLGALTAEASRNLRDVSGGQAKGLLAIYGKDNVNKLAPKVTGKQLQTEAELLGERVAQGVGAEKVKHGKPEELAKQADRLEAARSNELASPPALEGDGLVVDSNVLSGIRDVQNGVTWANLDAPKKASINFLRKRTGLPLITGDPIPTDVKALIGDQKLRVANITLAESEAISGVTRSGVPLKISRNSNPYNEVLEVLGTEAVGGNKGAADRAMVADLLFAQQTGTAKPSLLSGDGGLYKPLFNKFGPGKTKPIEQLAGEKVDAAIARVYGTTGFEVTIPDKSGNTYSMRVFPMK